MADFLTETRRRKLIEQGLAQINAIFGGGEATTYNVAKKYDPTQQYYRLVNGDYFPLQVGAEFTQPVAIGGGAFLSPQNLMAQGKIYTSTTANHEGFQPEFYQERKNAYTNFAMPQLMDQYEQTRRNLMYQLSRGGLSNSSAGIDLSGNLNKVLNQGQRTIVDEAQNQENQLRQTVEGNRQQTIQQLYSTSDPSQAANTAIQSAALARQPSSFTPIGNLFGQWAGLYNQNQGAQAFNSNVPNIFPFLPNRARNENSGGSSRVVT